MSDKDQISLCTWVGALTIVVLGCVFYLFAIHFVALSIIVVIAMIATWAQSQEWLSWPIFLLFFGSMLAVLVGSIISLFREVKQLLLGDRKRIDTGTGSALNRKLR